ncbi:hypothetical protein [Burkholderia vietnamiensis]|uniref:hypothetical protein n=1 Tax=Burkholderia vietnamiensis TaxID=60552 RepID=UPI001B9EEDB0|nr:hypothetical protein [Burkholderia vietnamiensis]MBR8279751.1 hypothetical protein [Burkholderia vietnamiensis]
MKEPILSREEVQEIQRKCDITFFVPDDSETWPGTYINLQQLRDYTARVESALLEKLCGEPAAWITWQSKDGKQKLEYGCIATNPEYCKAHDEWLWAPLYALNRSQS